MSFDLLSAEVEARKLGHCKGCSERIEKGEYIRKVQGKDWMHSSCASNYARHLENLKAMNNEGSR